MWQYLGGSTPFTPCHLPAPLGGLSCCSPSGLPTCKHNNTQSARAHEHTSTVTVYAQQWRHSPGARARGAVTRRACAGAATAALGVGAGPGPRVGAATPRSRTGPGALARAGARRPANTHSYYFRMIDVIHKISKVRKERQG